MFSYMHMKTSRWIHTHLAALQTPPDNLCPSAVQVSKAELSSLLAGRAPEAESVQLCLIYSRKELVLGNLKRLAATHSGLDLTADQLVAWD